MNTHNIWLYGELEKIIPQLSSILLRSSGHPIVGRYDDGVNNSNNEIGFKLISTVFQLYTDRNTIKDSLQFSRAIMDTHHLKVQSTFVISNSKGLTETLRDIRTSTYQSLESEENNKLNNHI